MIVCTGTEKSAGELKWHYKGVKYNLWLPVTLKADAAFDGQFADAQGKFHISVPKSDNNYYYASVTCEYKNITL
jgi:hypothetical protein